MSIRIGINGFGRIGRLVFRAIVRDDIEIVAVNAPDKTRSSSPPRRKFDSVRPSTAPSRSSTATSVVNGKNVKLLSNRDPSTLPGALGVDYVLECTGKF